MNVLLGWLAYFQVLLTNLVSGRVLIHKQAFVQFDLDSTLVLQDPSESVFWAGFQGPNTS